MGSRFLETRGSWSIHGLLQIILFGLWLTLLCYCLCLFHIIVELHAMDENNHFIGKWKWILCVVNAFFIHDIYFVYLVETFITLKCKNLM